MMPKFIPPPTPELNRLRAAAALVPIIEAGLADSKLSVERASLMASFCELASKRTSDNPEEIKLSRAVTKGLQRLKATLSAVA